MNNHYFIELFERELSEFTGAPYVVLTDSCTNALFLCLVHFKKQYKAPDCITIPMQTYIGVAQSILHAGYKISFKDEPWVGSYKLNGVPIEDSAVGFKKNMYHYKSTANSLGGMMCISFQQKKSLPIGKGGAILLDNLSDYNTLKRLAWDGRDASKPVKDDADIILGYHMNMTPDDAAKGLLLLNNYKGDTLVGNNNNYPNISGYFK